MIRTRSSSNRGRAARVGMLAAILPLLLAGCDSTQNPPDGAMDAPTPSDPAIAPTGPDEAAPPPPPPSESEEPASEESPAESQDEPSPSAE